MRAYGFSTGALALGDFERGLNILADHDATAVELSALRDHELPALMIRIADLDLSRYEYVSVHAPSRFSELPEAECARLLSACVDRGWPVVLHPDAIQDAGCWDAFGSILCLENMDKRKVDGRTLEELSPWFERFPEAGFCLDLGHARQVDPSLIETRRLIRELGDRLLQIHLSELDVVSRHEPLSTATVLALREIAHRLAPVPVILESRVEVEAVGAELRQARLALDGASTRECSVRTKLAQ